MELKHPIAVSLLCRYYLSHQNQAESRKSPTPKLRLDYVVFYGFLRVVHGVFMGFLRLRIFLRVVYGSKPGFGVPGPKRPNL